MPKLTLASQPYEVTFSRNPVKFRFKVTPYNDVDAQFNTVIAATLYCEKGHYAGDFREIKTVQLRPDADGFAYWDVQVLLDAQLSFFVPRLAELGPQAATSQGARYYIRYSLANDYEQLQAPQNTAQLHVLKGGLAYESLFTREFFEDKIIAGKQPLHFIYEGQEAAPDEPLWLYWIDPTGGTSAVPMQITISPYALPNAFLPATVRTAAGDSGKWQIWCCAIGFTQQGLQALLPAGTFTDTLAVKVERPTLPAATSLVDPVSWRLNYRNHYDTKTLLFLNSLGGLETQVFRGQIDISGSYDRQSVTLLDTEAFAEGRVLKAVSRSEDTRETAAWKGETGWIPEARAQRLRDLLRANEAWELRNNFLRPVNIATKSAQILSNTDKLFSIALDWNGTYADNNYTPEDYLEAGSFCPGMDFLEVTQITNRLPHVAWRIPEGYDLVELRWDGASAVPASTLNNTLFVAGNRGEIDVDVSALFPLPGDPNSTATLYFFGRVICNDDPDNFSAGAWKTFGPFTLNTYAPPVANNDFFTTYRGGGVRTLGSPLDNDYPKGAPTNFLLQVINSAGTAGYSAVGSAGGLFSVNSLREIEYTPPYAAFTGVDVCHYQIQYLAKVVLPSGFYYSPTATGSIYVKVEAGLQQVISLTGLPYLKLSQVDTRFASRPGGATGKGFTVDLLVEFFADPLGQIPMDMTGKNLTFILNNGRVDSAGAMHNYPVISFTANFGTSMVLKVAGGGPDGVPDGRWWTVQTGYGIYVYTIAPSSTYYVL